MTALVTDDFWYSPSPSPSAVPAPAKVAPAAPTLKLLLQLHKPVFARDRLQLCVQTGQTVSLCGLLVLLSG